MNLILQEIKEVVSTVNMPCEAVKAFFDFMNSIDVNKKMKYINDLFKVKLMKIQPTETYLNITFVDTETGEQLEMNCKKGVHKLCVERNIYPYIINKHFK